MTVPALLGSRVEAITFCPDQVARLSLSLDSSPPKPEETQQTLVLECSGPKTSWTLPQSQQNCVKSPGSVPGLSGSVSFLSVSSSCSY